MQENVNDLIRQEVEIIALGIRYAGTLIEVNDQEVHLQSPLQWIVLPVSNVTSIRRLGDEAREERIKFVDPSFYQEEP